MADNVKCACSDCKCSVGADKAITKDGKSFCCQECADGHTHHAGCNHQGCDCHG